MSAMGRMVEEFNVPVCNSFQAKILNDQLCYEVDLNRFADKGNVQNELKLGFTFLMDFNEDRQANFDRYENEWKQFGLTSNVIEADQDQQAYFYLNTVGEFFYLKYFHPTTQVRLRLVLLHHTWLLPIGRNMLHKL